MQFKISIFPLPNNPGILSQVTYIQIPIIQLLLGTHINLGHPVHLESWHNCSLFLTSLYIQSISLIIHSMFHKYCSFCRDFLVAAKVFARILLQKVLICLVTLVKGVLRGIKRVYRNLICLRFVLSCCI